MPRPLAPRPHLMLAEAAAEVPRAPRGAPAVVSHPANVRPITLSVRNVSLTPSIDSIISELRAANFYVRPGGQAGKLPHADPHPPSSASFTPYGLIATGGLFLGGAVPSTLYGTGYLDGTSATFVASQSFEGFNQGLSLSFADGLSGAIYSATVHLGPELLNVGAQLQLWRDRLRLGTAFVCGDLPSSAFAAGGGFVQFAPTARLLDMGAYIGPDSDTLARAHDLDLGRDGLRRIEVRRTAQVTASIRAGGGTFTLAGLVRFDLARARQTVLRTMASNAQTRALLFEGSGVRQYLRDRLRAMGLRRDIITIPKQHDWRSLRLGDELVVTRSGSYIFDALVGNLTAWAGAQVMMRGDVEVGVRRLDEHFLEVTLNPTRIRDVALYLFSPFGLELDAGRGAAVSYRQGLVFDMRRPAARRAYHGALEGRLRIQRRVPGQATARFAGGGALAHLVRHQNAQLVDGVERLYVHCIATRELRRGGGGRLGIAPRDMLPRGWTNTLAHHTSLSSEQQTLTNGRVTESASSHAVERRRELVSRGISSDAVVAQQRWLQVGTAAPQLGGLNVQATLLRSCVRRFSHNRTLIDRLNRCFATRLPHFARPGLKQQREVDVSRAFTAASLAQLAEYGRLRPGQAPLSAPHAARLRARLAQATAATGIGTPRAWQLLAGLRGAPSLAARLTVVQRFVQAHGLEGFGLVHRLLPGPDADDEDDQVFIGSVSSSYIDALTDAARLRLRYPRPMRIADGDLALQQRLAQINRALRHLARALLDVDDDPLISELERPLVREHLVAARQQVYEATAVVPGQAAAVVAAAQRASRFHPRRRRRLGAVPLLLEDVDAWYRRSARLAAALGRQPWAHGGPAAVLRRWDAVYPLAEALAARRRLYGSAAAACVPAAERRRRLAVLGASLRLLVGDGAPLRPGRPPAGIVDLRRLPPATRQALRPNRPNFLLTPPRRALAGHLEQLAGGRGRLTPRGAIRYR